MLSGMGRRLSRIYRTALVTGASAGLGLAMARALAAEGLEVWATSRDTTRVPLGKGIHPVALDLSTPQSVARFCDQFFRDVPELDVLVNNAGYGAFFPFEAFPPDEIDAQLQVLLNGPIHLSRAAYAGMRARPSTPTAIVNVSSLAADFPIPFMSLYTAAKAGLSGFTRTLALEARGSKVAVIDFMPGDYCTGFNSAVKRVSAGVDALPACERAWSQIEAHVNAGPDPAKAAEDLCRALARHRSGPVATGTFFQATLGPLLARFANWRAVERSLSGYYRLGG